MKRVRIPHSRRRAYLLLETVVATGMLIVGLAVLGAQVQDSHTAVRKMERRIRALSLAEQHLAELEMGLVDINSVDENVEGDFGPRFPDFGWLLTTEETAIEQMFMLRLDILHHLRDGDYSEDSFDYDEAELLETVYVMKAAPQPVNFGEDFGLNEKELVELAEKLDGLGIPGLDPETFDMRFFQTVDFETLVESAPVLLEAFGMSLDAVLAMLPPDVMRQIQESGILDPLQEEGDSQEQGEGGN
jgi:hypothetical protein